MKNFNRQGKLSRSAVNALLEACLIFVTAYIIAERMNATRLKEIKKMRIDSGRLTPRQQANLRYNSALYAIETHRRELNLNADQVDRLKAIAKREADKLLTNPNKPETLEQSQQRAREESSRGFIT